MQELSELGIVGGRKWVWSRRKFEELCWTWTVGWERKGERGIYLKVLFFSTSFLYLDFSFLFAVCSSNFKHVPISVSLFTWCKLLWLILGLCLCPFQFLILISPGGGPPTWAVGIFQANLVGVKYPIHPRSTTRVTWQTSRSGNIGSEARPCQNQEENQELQQAGSYTIWNARFSS